MEMREGLVSELQKVVRLSGEVGRLGHWTDVMGDAAFLGAADVLDRLAHCDYEDFAWWPRSGTGRARLLRTEMRRLVALPGLRDIDGLHPLACQVSGMIGSTLFDPATTEHVLEGWSGEPGWRPMQQAGRLMSEDGLSAREAADQTGLGRETCSDIANFIGVAEFRAQRDLCLTVELVRAGRATVRAVQVEVGCGASKAQRLLELARAEVDAA